jgi:NAD-dependent aldehyde dehydrogenases
MHIWREETFRPVSPVTRWSDAHDVLAMGKPTEYGFPSSLHPRVILRAMHLFEGLHSGICGNTQINNPELLRDIREVLRQQHLPWGCRARAAHIMTYKPIRLYNDSTLPLHVALPGRLRTLHHHDTLLLGRL